MSPRSPLTPIPAGSYESHFEHSALFEFSKVINSSLDPQFILSHILLTIMGKILSTKGVVILGKREGRFSVEMAKGFPGSLVGTELTIRAIPSSLFYVDKVDSSKHPWVKFFRSQGVQILLPMFIADKPIGLLGFGERFSGKKLTSIEVTYLRSLANISATAVEKSRTIAEIQHVNRKLDRKIQELNTLFEVGKELGALLDPDKIVRLLVFSLLGQIGINRYLICLKEGSDMKVVASRVDGHAPQSELLVKLAMVKSPVRVQDIIQRHAKDPREALTGIGLKVLVPMQLQGETKGIVFLGEKLNKEEFSDADLELLTSLSNIAVIALENARLFRDAIEKQKMEDELLIAREIQKGLLPSVIPDIPRFQVAAANISSKQVGGDYYDVLQVGDSKHVIAIGDVSGKGTPAALLMANLQATIRALVPLNLTLGELTGRVNDLMCENTGGDKFVTFFWGFIDHKAMNLTYVNAGHNYPYLLHADGTIERLETGGMILGVLRTTTRYEEATIPLLAGDIIILFTDGVSEAMSKESVEYGEDRLEALVRANTDRSAQEITGAIHRDILQHTKGAPQSDDITMMVVKVS